MLATLKHNESMNKDLQAQNRLLKQQLDDFMAEARKNEQKLRRFQSLELRLVSFNPILELIDAITLCNKRTCNRS